MEKNMPLITIFTPAYNRAYTLPRTYESLLKQDCKDFLWLVVDDGSTDNTAELIKDWQSRDNGFEIRYIYKENGGMHTAHNTAYENIDTQLNVCIDSDDRLADGAVSKIKQKWNEVKDKGYAGIVGLDADMNTGKIIGNGFPDGLIETTLNGYYAAGGRGDKKLIYRTDVVKKYPPYPVFSEERFVPLDCLYLMIDQDYKLAVLDDILCDVEYLEDGSTKNMFRQYMRNPKGFAYSRKLAMHYPQSKKRLLMNCIHYVSSSIISRNRHFISESPKKALTVLAIPFGAALTWYIRYKVKNA